MNALLKLLDIETLDLNLFRGISRDDGLKQVFGGHVIAQALVAAGRTVPADRKPQSLHAYFLRPGDKYQPIIYEVDRTRDGGSFTTRRVQAIQNGVPIFSMMASFHVSESGWQHQAAMPAVPPADQLSSGGDSYRDWLKSDRADSPGLLGLQALAERSGIEFRPVPAEMSPELDKNRVPCSQQLWFRSVAPIQDLRILHACVLAYVSDFNLLGTAKLAHRGYFGQPDLMMASLDHVIWFHQDVHLDDWMLYSMESPIAHAARCLVSGRIFDRSGRLIASVAQEGLMRPVVRAE